VSLVSRLRAYLARPVLDSMDASYAQFRQELIQRIRDGLAQSLLEYHAQAYAAGEMAGRRAVCEQLEQMLAERRDNDVREGDVERLRRMN
jgi:hypothetical protein